MSEPYRLNPGDRLLAGQRLVSPNGLHVLEMQGDGNLVLYAPEHMAVWHTGTEGHSGVVALMLEDGNFVLYAPGNVPMWATATDGHPGSILALQDDRNLVVIAPGNVPIWASGTNLPASPPPSGIQY
jgi:hypothetical protein